MKKIILIIASIISITVACRKTKVDETTTIPITTQAVISDFGNKLALPTYIQIKNDATVLQNSVNDLVADANDLKIENCRQKWIVLRSTWENCESFLFGPVATEELDPQVDTWPVNKVDLDSLLNSNAVFTSSYMQNLQESLKGFHAIEYIIFGTNGSKSATALTPREKDYLVALTNEMVNVCGKMYNAWEINQGNYITNFTNPSNTNNTYKTQREVLLEITNGIKGICEEVANGKMKDPFDARDPELEESKFSKTSFVDFKNNILGVKQVLNAKIYTQPNGTSTGLISWIAQYDKNLSITLSAEVENAIESFNTYTKPFGEAILDESERVKIANTQNAINRIVTTIDTKLIPLINQRVAN